MSARRARRVMGALSLLAVGGCVAISGLGDLEIGGDLGGKDGSLVEPADVGPSVQNDSSKEPEPQPDVIVPPFDAGFRFDSGRPDANLPDTGGPETGPAGAGIVQCSATLQCTDKKVCCYSAFFPVPSCVQAGTACPTGGAGLACDDDSDCAGQMCCITPDLSTYSASSACKATCPSGSYHACTADQQCGNAMTCKQVQLAPGPIKACQ